MDGLIINPKKREVMKDLHSYVTEDISLQRNIKLIIDFTDSMC